MDVRFEQVNFTYQPNIPFEQRALFDINMMIKENSYTILVGHTGNGKSTLLQYLNALVKPTSGTVHIGERDIQPDTDNKNLKLIRRKVGVVFQFPEAQLFEETVTRDIALGPRNFGVSEGEALALAKETLEQIGLDENYLERSPFELSGGQMRRVAIVGVLAMKPEISVLDEPTARLDPQGRKEMMEMLWRLHKEQQITIVLVTHLMDDVANFADYVYVLEKGRIVNNGEPQEVFQNIGWLKEKQLGVPTTTEFVEELMAKGMNFAILSLTAEELADAIVHYVGGNAHDE